MTNQFDLFNLNEYSDGEYPPEFLAQFPVANATESIPEQDPLTSEAARLAIAALEEDQQAFSGLLTLMGIVAGAAGLAIAFFYSNTTLLGKIAIIVIPTMIVLWGVAIALFGMDNPNSAQNQFLRRIYQGTLLILGISLFGLVSRLLYALFAGF